MSIKSFFNSKIRKMDWIDVGLVKFSSILFGILLAIFFPVLLDINIWWYVIAILILAARPFCRIYLK
jgi:hypothetical protein